MGEDVTTEEAIAYCDQKNTDEGRWSIGWLQLNPDENPELLTGYLEATGAMTGPALRIGCRYRIRYATPTHLPFKNPTMGISDYLVLEITGTVNERLWLENVTATICDHDDRTKTSTLRSEKSILRFFRWDTLEEVGT